MANYDNFALSQTAKVGFEIPLQLVPHNTLSDGIAPAGRFIVAPYLPLLRYNDEKYVHVVISSGKVVALDKRGQVVPAGLKLEADAYAAALATDVATADANALVRYTSLDVSQGVRNFAGALVVPGEPVVKSWFTGTTADNSVSYFCGVSQYDVFRHAGGDNLNPATIRNINFNPQPVISFLCDYHMQYPLVKDVATIRTAPLAGIAGVVSTKADIAPGTFLTYDRESNFVPTSDLYDFGTTSPAAIVGQVTAIRFYRDPDTLVTSGPGIENHNMLDKVIAPGFLNASTYNMLNQVPSSANDGLGTFITYSNGYGVVEFGLHTR